MHKWRFRDMPFSSKQAIPTNYNLFNYKSNQFQVIFLKISGRTYIVEEEVKRREIWSQNRQTVMKHNYEYDLGKHTYTMGMNKFADLV